MAKGSELAKPEDLQGIGALDEKALLQYVEGTEGERGTADAEYVDEARSNSIPELQQIKVKHSGAEAFQLPDGEMIAGKQGLLVVIGAHSRSNTLFLKDFEEREEGERPDCSSNDGVNIDPRSASPQSPNGGCEVCPLNRDAKDPKARSLAFDADKACANYLNLAVYRPGEELPYLLRVSAGSFKAWDKYVQELASRGRYRVHEVATKITLKATGRYQSSVAHFEMVGKGPLPSALREQYAKQFDTLRAVLRRDFANRGADDDVAGAAAAAAAAEAAAGSTSEGSPF